MTFCTSYLVPKDAKSISNFLTGGTGGTGRTGCRGLYSRKKCDDLLMSESVLVPDPGSKYIWGPRVWKLLHLLAEISDRRDVCFLWKNVLRSTANVLPCEKCRRHFNEYLSTHSILSFSNILHITGNDIRDAIVNTLFDFHNSVNTRLEKPILTKADYDEMYHQHRESTLLEAQKLYNEIKASWMPLVHTRVNGTAFAHWKHTLSLLFGLVSVGPLP